MIHLGQFRKIFALCLPLAALLFVTQCVMPPFAVAESARVKVQMGTPVDVVFDQPISSDTAVMGQQVTLKVANPVTVEGRTVIAAGAPVLAEVLIAKKSGMVGMAGTLTVTVKSVTAVDGTIVALSGNRTAEGKSNVATSVVITVLCCILGLLMKGEKADIAAGSSMRATVAGMVEVAAQ